MPARFRVVLLNSELIQPGNKIRWHFVLWANVQPERWGFYVEPDATSAWEKAEPNDIEMLQNGEVIESAEFLEFSPGATQTQIEQAIQNRWQAFQSEIDVNVYQRYGSTWDGQRWLYTDIH